MTAFSLQAEIITVPSGGSTGTAGAAGTNNSTGNGGNGGAGGVGNTLTGTATGLLNGATVAGGRGGAGGTSPSTAGIGGAGGRGVVSGVANASIQNNGTIVGGRGGNGGASALFNGNNGGAGGVGLTSSGAGTVILNTNTITGGAGGTGGNGQILIGTGGAGGTGVVITNGATLTNSGTISGGNVGAIGVGGLPRPNPGTGGVGITANGNTTIINSGTINGGLNSNGSRSSAITFTGSGNNLNILSGSAINGNVIATAAGGDNLQLVGTTDGTFDVSQIGAGAQYRNFSNFIKRDSSTWTLTGTTTAISPWIIDEGTLSIADDASLGDKNGSLTLDGGTLQTTASTSSERDIVLLSSGGTFDVASGTTYILDGHIAGFGGLQLSGLGTLVLANDNSFISDTNINSGTLQLGNGGATGSVSGDIINNGVLAVDRSDAYTFDSTISGSGQLQQNGSGTLVLTNNNSYTGGTAINNGTLQLGNGGTSGSITGDIANNSILAVDRSDAYTFDGNISGSGQLQQNGSGTLVLTNNNSYTGGTTINNGTLQLGNGGTSGSITGDIANNSILAIDRSDPLTLGGTISGSGQLQKNGTGELVLTGKYDLAGDTFVNAGALTFDGNSATTNIVGQSGTALNLRNGATLNGWVDPLDVNIDKNSVWNLSGDTNQNVVDTLTLAGHVNVAAAPSSDSSFTPRNLTVTNLVGQNGSITLNTELGKDGSPSDRVVIDGGRASGTTGLNINNIGGSGADTTGNGIEVVQTINGGTTDEGSFKLNRPVYGSEYQYSLLRGALDGSVSDNWYLSSDRVETEIITSPTTGEPVVVNRPTGQPNYRPGVSVSAAAPLAAAATSMALLSSFYERSGFYGVNSEPSTTAVAPCEQNLTAWCSSESRAWGRYIYQSITHKGDGKGVDGDAGPKYNQDISGIQFGNDLWRSVDGSGNRNYVGVYGTLGLGKSDVTHFDGRAAGTNHTDVYSLGTYFTHVHNNDAWVDAVLQGSWVKTRSQAQDNSSFNTDGYGVASSLEAGLPVINQNGWKVEPHIRAQYQLQTLDDANDGLSNISFNNYQSLQGSAGIRVSHSGLVYNKKYSAWVDGGAGQEFKGKSQTNFSSTGDAVPITTKMRGGFADVSAGGSIDVNKTLAVYTSANWTPRFDNTEYALGASIGVRGSW